MCLGKKQAQQAMSSVHASRTDKNVLRNLLYVCINNKTEQNIYSERERVCMYINVCRCMRVYVRREASYCQMMSSVPASRTEQVLRNLSYIEAKE